MQNFPFVLDVSRTITSEREEREANFTDKLYSICLTSCEGTLAILDLCSEGTRTAATSLTRPVA